MALLRNTSSSRAPLTNGNAAPTHADGDNGQVNTAISINESARLVIKPEAQSSNLDSFKAANTGGTFTSAGADAALFGVDATTGELKSHAFVDFENQEMLMRTMFMK